MKKLISIALVVVMLLSMIPATISAKSYEADTVTTAANVIDGTISDGEYAWTSGEYARGEDVENEFDAGVGCDAPYGKTLKSQWWLDYDQEFIYIAYKEDRHNASSQTIGIIDLNPGAKEQGQVSLAFTITGASASFEHNGYNFEVSTYDENGKTVVTEADYVVEKIGKNVSIEDANWQPEDFHNVLEFKISCAALAAYAGGTFDKIGIRAQINSMAKVVNDEGIYQDAVYGDPTSTAKAYEGYEEIGYHIIDLGEELGGAAPVELPSVTKVVIDGIVNEGEYKWVSDKYDREVEVENEFYPDVDCQCPDGNEMSSQWWIDWDENYIYVAYKEGRNAYSSQTIGIIDLNPGAKAQGQVSLKFTITGKNASFEYNGYNFEVSTYDGEGKHVVNETDFVKAKAAKQVAPTHNVLEFKIDRAALEAYAGGSFNELGIRAQINSYAKYIEAEDRSVYQDAVYGDPTSTAKAYDRHTDIGYHIVDVTPCVHDFGDGWYEVTPATCVDGEDNRICSICEGIEVRIVPASGDHEFGDWAETTPPTCADPGEKTRECINCDEEETAPVDATGEHDYQTIGISLEQHADVCTVCGDTINAEAHVDPTETSEGHTYWSPAYVAVDCSVCAGYKVAQAPINGRLLNTNGQRHIFCSATKAAPTVDGAVLAGEYTWSLKGVNANNLPVGTCASSADMEEVENVNFYVSYDDSKVYVAMEVTDRSAYVGWGTSAYVSVGGGDMLDGYQCYLAIANGATVIEAIQRTNNARSNVDLSGKAASYSTKSGSNYVYEIAFDREACGLTGDSMYLAMAVATSAGNIMFATKDVAVEGYDKLNFDAGAMYPNVLFFGTMEEKADYIATFGVDAPVCTHESAEYAYLNATKHQLVCFCGKVDTVEHSFVYFQNDEKSHTSFCVDCGAQVNEAHKTGTATSANELIHNITCVCGEAFSSEHIYGMINVLESATHTKAGKGEKACLVCDYVVAVDIPATTAHNFAAWTNDGDTHTSVCACGETVTEAHNYVDGVCSVCRAIKAAAPTEDAPNADGADDTTTDSGCKASVAAFAVALVAMLGTCTVFVAKKKD